MKYFIGIGGIGISALAKFYLEKGEKITGSDAYDSELLETLRRAGANIFIGQKKENLPENCTEVIYTTAAENNPETEEARQRGLKLLTYAEALGELTKNYFTIAVSGTHGKSTTTSMIGLLLIEAGLDPTVIVGTKLKEFDNTNFRAGKSKYMVIEACEHEAAFLNYYPQIGVITNIEADHLDYYKSLDNIKKAFKEFALHIQSDGFLVKERGLDIKANGKEVNFSLEDEEIQKIKQIIQLPGKHIILDALITFKIGQILGIEEDVILKSLSKFKGSWRRFDTSNVGSYIFIDDYAHHPTEINTTLNAVREKYKNEKICCVYEPHQYQRTYNLFDDFIYAFKDNLNEKNIDKLVLLPVYDVVGREGNDKLKEKYNSKVLSEKILDQRCVYLDDYQRITNEIADYDVVIMMGAGTIYAISQKIKKEITGSCELS
ncbi:UDP-N-acetylmuramate--L-alanine ligase [bacterium]|nr:UDP-N-acetylmuramate--L-alanine ligase [bacterium]